MYVERYHKRGYDPTNIFLDPFFNIKYAAADQRAFQCDPEEFFSGSAPFACNLVIATVTQRLLLRLTVSDCAFPGSTVTTSH